MQGEERSSVLDDQEVDGNDKNPDDEEGRVGEETVADVELIMDLSSGKHVDDLEPDEQVEDKGHVSAGVTIDTWRIFELLVELVTVDPVKSSREHIIAWFIAEIFSVLVESEILIRLGDEVLTSKEEDKEHDHLENGHVQDVLGHLTRDNEIVLDLRRSFEELWARQLGSKGKRSKGIHDHVNPKELNSLKGRLFEEDSTNDSEKKSANVDSQLELQETLDVVVDVTTPGASLDNGGEGVIGNDDVSSSLTHISSGDTHSESDISLGEGRGVIGTITSDSDNLVHVHETSDEKVLVFGARTRHNSQFSHELFELGEILDSLSAILDFTLTVVGAVLLADGANEAAHLLVELRAFNAN